MCHVKVDGDDEGCHHDEDEEGGVHLGHGLGVKPRHVSELGVDEQLPGETLQLKKETGLKHLFKSLGIRVTRRVFSEPITSKLHLLNTKNLAGHLKTPKVIRISAMHANFSHSPVHSGPICFNRTKNLKLPSGTNKSK